MSDFTQKNNSLYCEDIDLNAIAEKHDTPCYVYSRAAITRSYNDYALALGQHPGKVCYAVKANSNIAVLQVLARLGAGFDIVSKGELQRVLQAGGKAENCIFSGVGKTEDEMLFALGAGIHCFNVESRAELDALSRVAEKENTVACISIRVNPDVDAKTHPYISTGLKENKFGIDINDAPSAYAHAKALPNIQISGVDCHIGSQLTEIDPFMDALDRVLVLIDTLDKQGIAIDHLDIGGGLGVTYRDETPPPVADYVTAIKNRISNRNLALYFEPGRSIAANSGVLLTKVIYLKETADKNFAIVDAAMNDNIRPSLYQAWQDIVPVNHSQENDAKTWDIVGPICETGDFLGKDRQLAIAPGDLLALKSSGAYGFVMSSNYNSRGRAAEIMVDRDQVYLVRQRETFEDLIRGEQLIP